MTGPHDDQEIREGRTRTQTRLRRQRGAEGLVAMLGSIEGGKMVYALMAEGVEQPEKMPECSLKDAEPEPTSYAAACKSQYICRSLEEVNGSRV